MSLYQDLQELTQSQCLKFAIIKAESVIYLIECEKLQVLAKSCIDCANKWAESPTQESKDDCCFAADNAYAAAKAIAATDYIASYAAHSAVSPARIACEDSWSAADSADIAAHDADAAYIDSIASDADAAAYAAADADNAFASGNAAYNSTHYAIKSKLDQFNVGLVKKIAAQDKEA